jgi:hypothetical protein
MVLSNKGCCRVYLATRHKFQARDAVGYLKPFFMPAVCYYKVVNLILVNITVLLSIVYSLQVLAEDRDLAKIGAIEQEELWV